MEKLCDWCVSIIIACVIWFYFCMFYVYPTQMLKFTVSILVIGITTVLVHGIRKRYFEK